MYFVEKVLVLKVINMIIIYGIKVGNDCFVIKVLFCECIVGLWVVVSIREFDKYL